jgi:outer membrane protein assembly factor BamA
VKIAAAGIATLLLVTPWVVGAQGEASRGSSARPEPVEGPPRVRAIELVLPPGDLAGSVRGLLDLREGEPLSPRTLRTTVQRVYQTGRYRNVIIRARSAPPPPGESGRWVTLSVEAQLQRRLVRLSLKNVGSPVLGDAALRDAARLAQGGPFDDEDLRAASARLSAALARKGYRAARVDATVRGDAGVTVELAISAGPPTRVRSVRAEGDAGPAAAALARLGTRPGAVLDEERLADDVRVLRIALHAAGYRRARIGVPAQRAAGQEVDVVIPVSAGPHIVLAFRGNAAFPHAVLERQMGLEPDQPLDANAVDAAVERLRAFYRARGFAAARVEAEEQARGRDLVLALRVFEGLRHRILAIRFDGPEAHTQAWLLARLLAHLGDDAASGEDAGDPERLQAASFPGLPARPGPPAALPPGEFWEEASWDRAAERIADELREQGHLEAIYLGTGVELDGARRGVSITVRLREGPRTSVGEVAIEGTELVKFDALAPEVRLVPGEPYSYARVEEARSALLRRLGAQGHVYARVEVREHRDSERHTMAVRLVVDEGPQVRVGQIFVTGNRRTREDFIRGRLRLREGAVYDPEAAARSQGTLLETGVFRSVSLRLEDPDAPRATKDLIVEVVERPYASLTQSFGFSIAEGPRAQLEYLRPNLVGRALELSLRGKINYPVNVFGMRPDLEGREARDRIEGQVDLGLRSGRLTDVPVPTAARLNLIGQILHRPAYGLRQASGVAGVDMRFTPRTTFSLQYELEVDVIERTGAIGPLTQEDMERLRFDEGTTTLHSLRPSLTLDRRDNPVHPRRGWLATGSVEYEHSLGSPDEGVLAVLPGSNIHTNLLKSSGLLSAYLPIGEAVLALSVRGGQVFPLDATSRTIIPKRFFLGGASSLRGFGEEQLMQEDVRPKLAEEARQCATSPTGAGCTDRGRRIVAGDAPVSEGGEAFLLGKAELRVPMTRRLELGLFFDAGNLWLDPQNVDWRKVRPTAGAGARFVTPIGPAALDVGFNLDRDRSINESLYAVHFTIGMF